MKSLDNKMNLVAKVHYDVDFNDFEDADNVYKFEISFQGISRV